MTATMQDGELDGTTGGKAEAKKTIHPHLA